MCVVRLLAEILIVGARFCKTRTAVPHSIWHFRSEKGYAIFHCYEYHLDSLLQVKVDCSNSIFHHNSSRRSTTCSRLYKSCTNYHFIILGRARVKVLTWCIVMSRIAQALGFLNCVYPCVSHPSTALSLFFVALFPLRKSLQCVCRQLVTGARRLSKPDSSEFNGRFSVNRGENLFSD